MDPAIRAHQDDVLRLTTQVTEMGSHLEEALRAYHQLEDTLVAAQMALGGARAEVDVARLATDEAEAHRVGKRPKHLLFLNLLF
jgi:hypothetical protein